MANLPVIGCPNSPLGSRLKTTLPWGEHPDESFSLAPFAFALVKDPPEKLNSQHIAPLLNTCFKHSPLRVDSILSFIKRIDATPSITQLVLEYLVPIQSAIIFTGESCASQLKIERPKSSTPSELIEETPFFDTSFGGPISTSHYFFMRRLHKEQLPIVGLHITVHVANQGLINDSTMKQAIESQSEEIKRRFNA